MRNHTDILRKTAMDRMEETKQMTLRSTAADTSQLKLANHKHAVYSAFLLANGPAGDS